jgi:K+-transporting ATPase ATPase C chain
MSEVVKQLRPAIIALLVLTLITGVIYPLVITGIAQVVFPYQANGSLIPGEGGEIVGSALIGQPFDDPGYFWGRLSATGPVAYNAAASSGSNYGPLNPALIGEDGMVQGRINALREAEAAAGVDDTQAIPVDLVTASGSGLDPHISPAAADYLVARVAAVRGIDAAELQALVDQNTEGRTLGLLGEPRVNVLNLNRALDGAFPLAAEAPAEAEATQAPEATTEATSEAAS